MKTSRQIRRERREAERKAKKELFKQSRGALGAPQQAEEQRLKGEALSFRENLHKKSGIQWGGSPEPRRTPPSGPSGFVSQNSSSPASTSGAGAGFVSQRAQINRQNAQHSTGPRTTAGKLASSRNSLKHGLSTGQLIIPGENLLAFESLRNDLLKDHQPANATEELLVQEMAQAYWLTQRAIRLQNDCFTEDGVDEKRLALFLRYQTTHERRFHKALNTLSKLNRARQQAAGFVSHERANDSQPDGFVSYQNLPVTENATAIHPEIDEIERKSAA